MEDVLYHRKDLLLLLLLSFQDSLSSTQNNVRFMASFCKANFFLIKKNGGCFISTQTFIIIIIIIKFSRLTVFHSKQCQIYGNLLAANFFLIK